MARDAPPKDRQDAIFLLTRAPLSPISALRRTRGLNLQGGCIKMKKGFTLIELLIVIAIIAILALIAVPNFLEAQVRAKTSRVISDMRTVAVAIEAYTVDWGREPIGVNEGSIDHSSSPFDLWMKKDAQQCYNVLTTPVAFISSVPRDPFILTDQTGVRKTWKSFTYQHYYGGSPPKFGVSWSLYSPGPDGKTDSPWLYQMLNGKHLNNVYDATNGTISKGVIWWLNKGGLFRRPL